MTFPSININAKSGYYIQPFRGRLVKALDQTPLAAGHSSASVMQGEFVYSPPVKKIWAWMVPLGFLMPLEFVPTLYPCTAPPEFIIMIMLSLHQLIHFVLTRLEALRLDLSLGSGDGGSSLGVDEATSQLVVLERGSLGGADALALAVVGAACGPAVGIIDAATSDELGTGTATDILSTGVVGLDESERSDGD